MRDRRPQDHRRFRLSGRLPLSAGDLIEIRQALRPLATRPAIFASPLSGPSEGLRPGGPDVFGHFVLAEGFDGEGEGWFGFLANDAITGEPS